MAQLDADRYDSSWSPGQVWHTGLTVGSVVVLVGAVLAAFVLRNAFVAAHQVIGWVVACAIVALLVDPLVDRVDRLLPRWLSVVVVLLVMVATVAGVTVFLVNDVQDSLDELQRAAPAAAAELEGRYAWAADVGVAERVGTFVDTLNDRLRDDALSQALGTAPTYFVTGILMLFLLAFGRRYFDSLVEQFSDPARRRAVRTVGIHAALRGRSYLLIAIANGIVNGIVVGFVAMVLDLPAAASLGVGAGMLTPLPLIGVLLGGAPALLLAFGFEGWPAGATVLAVLIGLQLVEALVVRRIVDPRTVRVGPTVPIVISLLGFELYGFGGAVYGLALAIIGLAALDAVGAVRADAPAAAAR